MLNNHETLRKENAVLRKELKDWQDGAGAEAFAGDEARRELGEFFDADRATNKWVAKAVPDNAGVVVDVLRRFSRKSDRTKGDVRLLCKSLGIEFMEPPGDA